MMQISYYYDKEFDVFNPSIVHVMKMCQAFKKNGVDVTLYCNSNSKNSNADAVFKKYGIEEKFEIKTVQLPEFVKKHGHRFGAYYSAWLKARNYAGDKCAYGRSAMALYFIRNRSLFIFEAHIEPDLLNRQIERRLLRHKNCRGLVVISHALKKRYLELFPFFPEEKITVLHDAADLVTPDGATRADLCANDSEVKIGYVGSLFPGKCMETLLPLAQRCPEYRIHIVGGSEYWVEYWKKQAQKKGIQNLVFYGHVDNSRVGEYYRAFDICILPFSKDIYTNKSKRVNIGRWTSPLKLFEAMAYGKPIIVSRLETVEEVLADHEDCVMAEPDDNDDWAEKLSALCADKELQKRIGHAALNKLEKEYTWSERARKVVKIFE